MKPSATSELSPRITVFRTPKSGCKPALRTREKGKETRAIASQLSAFALALFLLFSAFVARAETTNGLSAAEIQGRKLAWDLCHSSPEQGVTNTGVLQIRSSDGERVKIPIRFEIVVTESNWQAIYQSHIANAPAGKAMPGQPHFSELKIVHSLYEPDQYLLFQGDHPPSGASGFRLMSGDQLLEPFATSDFWLCDLGTEFFRWPEQKVLPKTTNLKRGRSYTLLESTNPNPSTNGYSRVVTWVDQETGGILEAEAYDARGKKLKEFAPKSFEKNKTTGQWELQEMEIRNVQTDSRTRIEFDLKKD